jgi:hypothetical protein
MRNPILDFTQGLRVYASSAEAERALAQGAVRALDAFDASGRPLHLVEGGRGWFGLGRKSGLRLDARRADADTRRALRSRLVEALASHGASRKWAEGAPLGALVADAARRLGV